MEELKFSLFKKLFDFKYQMELRGEVSRIKKELFKARVAGKSAKERVNVPGWIWVLGSDYDINKSEFIADVVELFSDLKEYQVSQSGNPLDPNIFVAIPKVEKSNEL